MGGNPSAIFTLEADEYIVSMTKHITSDNTNFKSLSFTTNKGKTVKFTG